MLTSFPLQQWLHARTSVLRYTYIACLAILKICFCSNERNSESRKVKRTGKRVTFINFTTI
jgi:hypothetical protein